MAVNGGRDRGTRAGARALGMARAVLGRVVTIAAGALPETPRRILEGLAPRLAPPRPRRAQPELARPTNGAGPDRAPIAATRRPLAEPIQTRTMARVLAEQGYHTRALAIYETLAREHPDDRALREEIEAVRAEASKRRPARSAAGGDDEDAGQEVALVTVDAGTVLVSWEVDEAGVARARAVLGAEGVLAARLVVVSPDPDRLVRSETRERRRVPNAGQWVVDEVPKGAHATASIGLLEGERFVSIAHTPTLRH